MCNTFPTDKMYVSQQYPLTSAHREKAFYTKSLGSFEKKIQLTCFRPICSKVRRRPLSIVCWSFGDSGCDCCTGTDSCWGGAAPEVIDYNYFATLLVLTILLYMQSSNPISAQWNVQ